MSNVHNILKTVAGAPNWRPAWYFDITEQGEALADTGTHLVDRVHETLFPQAALDYRRDIRLYGASRWPIMLSLAQFSQVAGEATWPDFLGQSLKGGALEYFCNGRLDYAVCGVHVRLEARWEWQTPSGEDTHAASFRGTRARLELRQGPAESWRQQLYVVPEADIGAALEKWVATAQADFPGVGLDRRNGEWPLDIPDALRLGHDAHFAAFTRRFLERIANPDGLPARHRSNLLAKYYVTTEGVALSHGRTS